MSPHKGKTQFLLLYDLGSLRLEGAQLAHLVIALEGIEEVLNLLAVAAAEEDLFRADYAVAYHQLLVRGGGESERERQREGGEID